SGGQSPGDLLPSSALRADSNICTSPIRNLIAPTQFPEVPAFHQCKLPPPRCRQPKNVEPIDVHSRTTSLSNFNSVGRQLLDPANFRVDPAKTRSRRIFVA